MVTIQKEEEHNGIINQEEDKGIISLINKKSKVELTEELVNQIKEYHGNGLSCAAIDKITGVNKNRILEIIHGKDKINGRYKKSTSALNPDVIEQIKQLLQDRYTKVAIEQMTGVSKYYITKIQKGEPVPIDGILKTGKNNKKYL